MNEEKLQASSTAENKEIQEDQPLLEAGKDHSGGLTTPKSSGDQNDSNSLKDQQDSLREREDKIASKLPLSHTEDSKKKVPKLRLKQVIQQIPAEPLKISGFSQITNNNEEMPSTLINNRENNAAPEIKLFPQLNVENSRKDSTKNGDGTPGGI